MPAVIYKSQGAGAAVTVSGTALQPACPATVDAGDILIAHVCYRDTVTTPSTPANWELLAGPQSAGSTATGRHWIFGKIAVGNEDGTNVSFGGQAVTVVRHARIYSFANGLGSAIATAVAGFSHHHEVGGSVEVPVEREQPRRRVKPVDTGPTGKRLEHRSTALAPLVASGQLREPETDQRGHAVGGWGRCVFDRFEAGLEQSLATGLCLTVEEAATLRVPVLPPHPLH